MLLKSIGKCLSFQRSKLNDEIRRAPLDWGKIPPPKKQNPGYAPDKERTSQVNRR